MRIATLLYGMAAMLGCGFGSQAAQAQAPDRCPAEGDIKLICGDSAAEDMLAIPGTNWIVTSAFTGSGGLRLIDSRSKRGRTVNFSSGLQERFDRGAFPDCPGPLTAEGKAKFITHGLALAPSRGKVRTLYAIHHGSRESIEIFTLDASQASPTLTWTGCIVAPASVGLNSLVVLPDGGIVASNFMPPDADQAAEFKKVLAGENNGQLWQWQAGKGWANVPGSDGSGLNGMEISRDGKTLYVAAWGSQSLTRMPLDGRAGRSVNVPLGFRVDNLRWTPDGLLLAGGQTDGGSKIVAIDPASLKVAEVAAFADTPGFANGTVAIQNGKEIWIGSYGSPNIAVIVAPVRRSASVSGNQAGTEGKAPHDR